MSEIKLKEKYTLAKCCSPEPQSPITGYFSHTGTIKVHRQVCLSLDKSDPERLVTLDWSEVLAAPEFEPGESYQRLEPADFAILKHHLSYGIDYSAVVGNKVGLPRQEAFDRHRKLRKLKLIERVEPTMVQYRKGIAPNKWIKHRNHTYYNLTDLGRSYLKHHREQLD